MSEWIRSTLDLTLIAFVAAGLVQAARLIGHLAGLRKGRLEMERFVHEFNATVSRAEQGIKGLRNAARESGDDLEKLVEKALLVRDELNFIVESADALADRLAQSAEVAKQAATKPSDQKAPKAQTEQDVARPPSTKKEGKEPSAPSRAEKELLQALEKLN